MKIKYELDINDIINLYYFNYERNSAIKNAGKKKNKNKKFYLWGVCFFMTILVIAACFASPQYWGVTILFLVIFAIYTYYVFFERHLIKRTALRDYKKSYAFIDYYQIEINEHIYHEKVFKDDVCILDIKKTLKEITDVVWQGKYIYVTMTGNYMSLINQEELTDEEVNFLGNKLVANIIPKPEPPKKGLKKYFNKK